MSDSLLPDVCGPTVFLCFTLKELDLLAETAYIIFMLLLLLVCNNLEVMCFM